MYPVTQDFLEKMRADERRIHARIEIDYTDPFLDQSIEVQASEQANISYPAQTADAVSEPYAKFAALDGAWVLGQDWALAPGPDEASTKQMGWWGSQLSQVDGTFVEPYPSLTVTHFARPIHSLKVVGDSKRGEWPVDFRIDLYGPDGTLLYTENVTGNNSVEWSKTLANPVLDVVKQVLTIMKWSHPGRQAKILEFFTSVQETYEGDDILLIHLLEEREVSQGSLPVGNISANEIDIRLNNSNRKFDAGNTQSPLYQLLKQNRRIRAWLGAEAENNYTDKPPTFTRNSIAYKSDGTQVAANQPRFESGKFGKAIMVEEGTTNLFTNPGWLDGTLTGWANYSNGNATGIRTVELDSKYGYRLKLERTGGQPSDRFGISQNKTWSASGSSLTISVYFKVVSAEEGAKLRIYTDLFNPSNTPYYGRGALVDLKTFKVTSVYSGKASVQALEDGWYYFTCTPSETDNSKGSIFFWIEGGNAQIYLAWSHVEAKPYATSFIDDTRADEALTIPGSVLNPQEGTVECWVKAQDIYSRRRDIFTVNKPVSSDDRVILGYNVTGTGLELHWRPANATAYAIRATNLGAVTDWVYAGFRYKWNGTGYDLALLYNGQVVATGTATNGQMTNFYQALLGCTDQGSGVFTNYADMLFDDLRISSIARSDEEILAAYQSGQPLPVDEWTTYKLTFDGSIYPVEKVWIPLGTFWSGDWSVPEDGVYAQTTGRDRLELLRKSTYSTSTVQQNKTLYDLAVAVLQDAGLKPEEYWVDPELQNYVVPYAYFEPQSHREALRKIAEACLGQVYCDRNGIVRVEGPSYLASKTEAELEITADDYFRKDNPVKWSEIANYIEVETQPLRPVATPQEVYRSNEPVSIQAGQTITITAYYNETPCIDAVASLEGAPSGCVIQSVTYYAWGADVKVYSPSAGTFTLVINARPLKVLNKERAIAKDDASIIDNGLIKYTFPANPLVQTRDVAQNIANKLLAAFKEPRRDVEVEWRGNPALLLGDRVKITDRNEQNDYYVVRQELEYSGALRARLSGRRAT